MTIPLEFIDNTKILQSVTERLDDVSDDKKFRNIEMNHELVEAILDLYNDDEDFPFEKMRKFSIADILSYLQATHRYYLSRKLPEIEQSLVHIFSKYAQSHQLLASLAFFFNAYKNRLVEHIRMEEKQLFPYIRKLIIASEINNVCAKTLDINTEFSIEKFIAGHSAIEDELKEVSQIIKQYSTNSDSIPLPYKIFLNQVDFFELELRKHAIIEDHILVPMVIELENRLLLQQS